jgi:hypothetical protein
MVIASGLVEGAELGDSTIDVINLETGVGARARPWDVPRNSQVVGVLERENDTGYEVIVQDARGQFTKQAFDADGLALGRAQRLSNSDIVALERELDMDLSSDDFIGAVIDKRLSDQGLVHSWYGSEDNVYSLYMVGSNWQTALRNATNLGGTLAIMDSEEEVYEVFEMLDGFFATQNLNTSSITRAFVKGSTANSFKLGQDVDVKDEMLSFVWLGASYQGTNSNGTWKWANGEEVDLDSVIVDGALTGLRGQSLSMGLGNVLTGESFFFEEEPLIELASSNRIFYLVEFSSPL